MTAVRGRLEDRALAVMSAPGKGYLLVVGILCAIVAWGVYAYSVQFRDGLVVTGLRDRILWGFYMSNFVFVIGISYGGTLMSAVLRVTSADWRRPITRLAEMVAVIALCIGAIFPIIDIGRPDRFLNVFIYGRWQSPIIWDIIAIFTYLVFSFLYLFLLMIPDMAILRDRYAGGNSRWRHELYKFLAIGWNDSPRQKKLLGWSSMAMAIIIIPVAVSVHSVLAFVFSMTLREGWNSTILGPFFVAGAVYSGVAAIIIVTAVVRKAYHLEEFITKQHIVYLGYFLGALSLVMIYANVAEYLTVGYKLQGEAAFNLTQLTRGQLAPFFWFYIIGGLLLPGVIILIPWTRNVWGIVLASVLVVLAMGAERYYIIVSALRVPQMPYEASVYAPTWVEISVVVGSFALFGLLVAVFLKLFPIISIWEVAEQHEPPSEDQSESPLLVQRILGGGGS